MVSLSHSRQLSTEHQVAHQDTELDSFVVKSTSPAAPPLLAQEHGEGKEKHRHHLYQPLWLRKSILAALTVFFILLLVALVALWRVVASKDGLSLVLTSSHYAWTYGPSAVLVALLSVWRQVDYHCKLTQPWRQMRSTLSPPERSVLLDYISPLQVVTLAKSTGQRHYPVALSVLGFFVLKVAILISTTLFVPEQTLRSEQRPILHTSSFNVSSLRNQVDVAAFDPRLGEFPFGYPPIPEILWGYVRQLNGEPLDKTLVMDNMLYQSFRLPSSEDNIASVTAAVHVFKPIITCEDALITIDDGGLTSAAATLKSATCGPVDTDRHILGEGEEGIFYDVSILNCSGTLDVDTRLSIGVYDLKRTNTEPTSYSFNRGAATVCKIDFSFRKADATQEPPGNPTSLTDFRTTSSSIDLDSRELARYLFMALFSGDDLQIETDIPPSSGADTNEEGQSKSMFLLMHKYFGPNSNWNTFFDQRLMSDAAAAVLEGLTLQLGLTQLSQPGATDGVGTVRISEEKLHLRKEPMFLMIACFAVLGCFATIIILLVGKSVVPQDPGSIASHATILSSSPSLADALGGTGHLGMSALKRHLGGFQFRLKVSDEKFSIDATKSTSDPNLSPIPRSSKHEVKDSDWIPFAARIPMLGILFSVPIIIIAVLEILQRISDSNNGVFSLSDSNRSNVTVYAARYCSTLAIFLVAMLFNNLDFVISTFTPFSALRARHSAASQASVFVNLVGETPIVALYKSIRHRYFGTAFSISAALLGSLLTVVVSNLWLVDTEVMHPVAVTADVASWNLGWSNSNDSDNGAARLLNTIAFEGSLVPTTVLGEHVLPDIVSWTSSGNANGISSGGAIKTESEFNLEVDVQALRPVLDCLVVPQEDITYNTTTIPVAGTKQENAHDEEVLSVEAAFNLPAGCWLNPSRNSSKGTLDFASEQSHIGAKTADRIGVLYELDTGPAGSATKMLPGDSSIQQEFEARGCPSLGFLFGQFNNITALVCSQKIQTVDMKVSYKEDPSLNQGRLSQTPSLLFINNSATAPQFARDPESRLPTFRYRVKGHLETDLIYFDEDTLSIPSGWSRLFDHLLHGPLQVNRESLQGAANTEQLIAAINKIYNSYMTLVIDMNFRPRSASASNSSNDAAPNSDDTRVATGTFREQVARLRMNNAPKLVLQIMIGAMLVLMAVAVRMVRIRRTLPRSPFAIGSVMGFLAGSRVCGTGSGLGEKIIPPGSEFLTMKELKRELGGQRWRLGWWDHQNNIMDSNQEGGLHVVPQEAVLDIWAGEAEGGGDTGRREWNKLVPTPTVGIPSVGEKGVRFGIDVI